MANKNRRLRTILLTSPGPAEGKSTTVANLAIMMARKGVKTLLVDSDLRRPVLDMLFLGASRKIGITNYLDRQITFDDSIRETSVVNLDLMAAGMKVKNAPELLSSKAMITFMNDIKTHYGIVLFDSPPMLPITDATILSAVVDGVILVIRAEKTSKESVIRSVDLIKQTGTQFLGILMTGINIHQLHGYKDYYSYYMEEMEEQQAHSSGRQ